MVMGCPTIRWCGVGCISSRLRAARGWQIQDAFTPHFLLLPKLSSLIYLVELYSEVHGQKKQTYYVAYNRHSILVAKQFQVRTLTNTEGVMIMTIMWQASTNIKCSGMLVHLVQMQRWTCKWRMCRANLFYMLCPVLHRVHKSLPELPWFWTPFGIL